jgi:hypothetical protein
VRAVAAPSALLTVPARCIVRVVKGFGSAKASKQETPPVTFWRHITLRPALAENQQLFTGAQFFQFDPDSQGSCCCCTKGFCLLLKLFKESRILRKFCADIMAEVGR